MDYIRVELVLQHRGGNWTKNTAAFLSDILQMALADDDYDIKAERIAPTPTAQLSPSIEARWDRLHLEKANSRAAGFEAGQAAGVQERERK